MTVPTFRIYLTIGTQIILILPKEFYEAQQKYIDILKPWLKKKTILITGVHYEDPLDELILQVLTKWTRVVRWIGTGTVLMAVVTVDVVCKFRRKNTRRRRIFRSGGSYEPR